MDQEKYGSVSWYEMDTMVELLRLDIPREERKRLRLASAVFGLLSWIVIFAFIFDYQVRVQGSAYHHLLQCARFLC